VNYNEAVKQWEEDKARAVEEEEQKMQEKFMAQLDLKASDPLPHKPLNNHHHKENHSGKPKKKKSK